MPRPNRLTARVAVVENMSFVWPWPDLGVEMPAPARPEFKNNVGVRPTKVSPSPRRRPLPSCAQGVFPCGTDACGFASFFALSFMSSFTSSSVLSLTAPAFTASALILVCDVDGYFLPVAFGFSFLFLLFRLFLSFLFLYFFISFPFGCAAQDGYYFCTACVFGSVVPPKSFITRQVT